VARATSRRSRPRRPSVRIHQADPQLWSAGAADTRAPVRTPAHTHRVAERVECGDADTRLAFTATVETDAAQRVGTLTTEVLFKANIGRAYFALVKPFHRRIIPALIAAPFPTRAREQPIR
jgi:hypothetical protein